MSDSPAARLRMTCGRPSRNVMPTRPLCRWFLVFLCLLCSLWAFTLGELAVM